MPLQEGACLPLTKAMTACTTSGTALASSSSSLTFSTSSQRQSTNRTLNSWSFTSRPVMLSVAALLPRAFLRSTIVSSAQPMRPFEPLIVLNTSPSPILRVWCTTTIATSRSSANALSAPMSS